MVKRLFKCIKLAVLRYGYRVFDFSVVFYCAIQIAIYIFIIFVRHNCVEAPNLLAQQVALQ